MTTFSSNLAPVILVADDSIAIASMVSSRFARSGYEVITAANGEDALRLARERRPALAIVDIDMPGMSGLEVAVSLRDDPATNAIPVILLTGYQREEDIAGGFAAGAVEYITKPFSPQELEARVERILGRR